MTTLMPGWAGWLLLALFAAALVLPVYLTGRRRTLDSEEFLLASRRQPARRAAPAIAANWIWAPALFVAAQQGYQHGWVGVFWFTVPNVGCLILFGVIFPHARRRFPSGYTASDVAGALYSRRVQRLYLVGLIGLAVCSFAVQLLAGGLVISTLTGIPLPAVTVALAAIALSYSLRRGLGALMITKLVDITVILAVGLGLAIAVAAVAGPGTIAAGLTGATRDYSSLLTGPGGAVFWSFGLSTCIGLLSGPFGDQSFWQLGWSIRSDREVRPAFFGGAALFAVVPIVMSLLGFAAAGAGLTPGDLQLTNLTAVLHWLPSWTALPFVLYVLAGLVSTMDSQLCSVSSLAGVDLAGPGSDGARIMRWGRLAMIALALLGLGIANLPGLTVTALFIFYGTLRASTLTPTLLALLWRSRRPLSERGTFTGILLALLVGLPISAYGNLTGTVPAVIAGSLAVIILPAGSILLSTALRRPEHATVPPAGDRAAERADAD